MLRGTQKYMPRSEPSIMPMGEPACQTPTSRWPRVRIMAGAACWLLERQRRVQRSSDSGDRPYNQIIEVLNFGDRPQAAHSHADGLAHDRPFADPGIKHPFDTVFLLHAAQALIHVADMAHVFAESKQFRLVLLKIGVEAGVQHLITVLQRRLVGKAAPALPVPSGPIWVIALYRCAEYQRSPFGHVPARSKGSDLIGLGGTGLSVCPARANRARRAVLTSSNRKGFAHFVPDRWLIRRLQRLDIRVCV
jgi:hypothetical protein